MNEIAGWLERGNRRISREVAALRLASPTKGDSGPGGLRQRWSRCADNPIQSVRMIRRRETAEDTDNRALLREALRAGVRALADTEIEARVREYFEQNPSYSRDAVHVAAVACRFQAERVSVPADLGKSTRANPVSQSP